MDILVHKSEVSGVITAPPSKSYTIRALMCAALANGVSVIRNPLICEDTDAAIDVLRKVGVTIACGKNSWVVAGGDLRSPTEELYCGSSGLTFRLMLVLCALIPGESTLTCSPQLARRPIVPLVQVLESLGVKCTTGTRKITIQSSGKLDGHIMFKELSSSQFLSAVLMVMPNTGGVISIGKLEKHESLSYALMTIDCMERFGAVVKVDLLRHIFTISQTGYRPAFYTVEGDWSAASVPLALGATCGEVGIEGLHPESLQPDRRILRALRAFGAVTDTHGGVVTVRKHKTKDMRVDVHNSIDLVPVLGVLGCFASVTQLYAARAKLKESDRIQALVDGLRGIGVKVSYSPDGILVSQPAGLAAVPALIDSHNDHRIAMAFSIPGAALGSITIRGAECVGKSYPDFWDHFKKLGGEYEQHSG